MYQHEYPQSSTSSSSGTSYAAEQQPPRSSIQSKGFSHYTYRYQQAPSQSGKDSSSSSSISQTYYQPLSYSTQTSRTVHRTASPMISRYPQQYQPLQQTSQVGQTTQSASKYTMIQQSSEKDGSQQSDYRLNNYLPPSTSPFSTSFNPAQSGTSSNTISALKYSGIYSNSNFPRPPTYSNTSSFTNTPSNSSTAAYTPTPRESMNIIANESTSIASNSPASTAPTQSTSIPVSRYVSSASYAIPSKQSVPLIRPSNGFSHTRAASMYTFTDDSSPFGQSSQLTPRCGAAAANVDDESMSPSKKVTFNLARNTYTDIDQIEKRLNESTKPRLIVVEDSDDIAGNSSIMIPLPEGDDDESSSDLNTRFTKAVNRTERIIHDFLKDQSNVTVVDSSGQKFKQSTEHQQCTTPIRNNNFTSGTPKLVCQPSRSKSPMKPSLKRTLSYSSPKKNITGIQNLANQKHQQQQMYASESPLTNQTNKMNTAVVQSYQGSSQRVQVSGLQTNIAPSPLKSPNTIVAHHQQSVSAFNDENSLLSQTLTAPHKQQRPSSKIITMQDAKENKNDLAAAVAMTGKQNQYSYEDKKQVETATMTTTTAPSVTPLKGKKGILKYSDGSRYDGEVLSNQRHGFGTLMSNTFQVIYQGNWKNDTYDGHGQFFNPLSENLQDDYDYSDFDVALSSYWESYEGEFSDGKLNGFGTLQLTNGEKLVGNFKKGRISGKGTYYRTNSPAVTGNWDDNRLIEKY